MSALSKHATPRGRDAFAFKDRVLKQTDRMRAQRVPERAELHGMIGTASAWAGAAQRSGLHACREAATLALSPLAHLIGLLPTVLESIKGVDPAKAKVACRFIVGAFGRAAVLTLGAMAISGVHFERAAAHSREVELTELRFTCLTLLATFPRPEPVLLAHYCGESAVGARGPQSEHAAALEKPTASDDGRRRCCIAGAAAYTDTGLLLARDCLVEWYAAFGVAVTLSASATELRSCVDEDRDGVATDSELSRLVGCAQFPDADLPSIVTIESRRDLLRGC